MAVRLPDRTADVIVPRYSAIVQRMPRHRPVIMGSLHRLTAALVLALGPVAGAVAQDSGAAPVGPGGLGGLGGFQLDPSRDPNKAKGSERAGPEIDSRLPTPAPAPTTVQPAPVVIVPPLPIRTAAPTSAPAHAPRDTPEARPGPGEQPTPFGPRAREDHVEPPVPTLVQGDAAAPLPTTLPPAESEPAGQPAILPPPSSPAEQGLTAFWPWWIAAAAAACAIAAGPLLRRRRRPKRLEGPAAQAPAMRDDASAPEPMPAMVDSAPTVPPPATPAPVAIPASETMPNLEAERPRAALALEFVPTGARSTLIGAAVGYRLTLLNNGDLAADNIAIAATIANADAQQEQALAGFFAAPVDGPVHMVARIAPGEAVTLTGELRLANDAIVPIQLADRALLIPLVAFSAHYGWDGERRGYSAAAFIIGQESDPPRARMAPFRIDQGPRQYRSVGSRAALSALVT